MLDILLVCQVRLHRDALRRRLSELGGIHVVGATSERDEAVDVAKQGVDVVLLDVSTPASLHIVEDLSSKAPSARIVALGIPDFEEVLIPFVEAGIDAYLPVDGSLNQLATTLQQVTQREATVSPRIAASLFRHISKLASGQRMQMPASLTRREREIARLLEQGLSNKEISRRLGIQVATVKNHVHSILGKLCIHRRSEVGTYVRDRRAAEEVLKRRQASQRLDQIDGGA